MLIRHHKIDWLSSTTKGGLRELDDYENGGRVTCILNNFDKYNPKDTKVGINEENTYNNNVRISQYIDNVKLDYSRHILSDDNIKHILYPGCELQSFVEINKYQVFQLHRYQKGGFFAKHIDGKKTSRHFATLLLFPPATDYPFEGGNLILYPPTHYSRVDSHDSIIYTLNNGENISVRTPLGSYLSTQCPVIIELSKLNQWTSVIFNLDIPHECTLVIKGYRYMFKTELEMPDNEIKIGYPIKVNHSSDIIKYQEKIKKTNRRIQRYKKKIIKYEEKIAKYDKKILSISDNTATNKISELIDEIERIDGNVVVVLGSNFPTNSCLDLKGEEAIFWNIIIEKWPKSYLCIKNASQACGREKDGYDARDYLYFDDDSIDDTDVFYWKSPETHTMGLVKNSYVEYNDEYFGLNKDVVVAIIFIDKSSLENHLNINPT